MTPEEEKQLELLAQQRRGGRTLAMYGGPPPNLDDPITLLPGYRTSGYSGPCSTLNSMPRQILKHSSRLKIGFADTVGRRATMEDEIVIYGHIRNRDEDFIAIYDGHNGSACSEFASKHLHQIFIDKLNKSSDIERSLKESFIETNDNMLRENIFGGSTAIVAFFKENKIYIANAGDSRAVISKDNKATRCSTDHKPDNPDEESRIKNSGGTIVKIKIKDGKTIARVNGQLAISRALGDHIFKPYVTSEPEVKVIDITPQNKFLVIACDGLWDVLEDQETLDIIVDEQDPSQAAIKLRDTAYNRGSGDNISVVVILIPEDFNGNYDKLDKGSTNLFVPTISNKIPLNWKIITFILVIGILAQQFWRNWSLK